MRFGLVLLMMTASPASAEAWIDYEMLLTRRADQVLEGKDDNGALLRRIDFADGVSVVCTGAVGQADCYGVDSSPDGAVGCLLMITAELQAAISACDGLGTEAQRQTLGGVYDRVGQFVAANAVPPLDWATLRAQIDGGYLQRQPPVCAELAAEGSDVRMMLEGLTAEPALTSLDKGLSVPRLPVANPCL